MTGGGPKSRLPRPATPERLEKAALHYLERYATSSANLRRVLMRRVERSARLHGTDREDGARQVDAIVARLAGAGLLDDGSYAAMRSASLSRRGDSPRAIRAKLAQKGVPEPAIEAALAGLAAETGDPELAGAARLARRRRIGPYRPAAARAANRDRDMAALARAGFGFDVIRTVIDADDADSLETAVAEAAGGA